MHVPPATPGGAVTMCVCLFCVPTAATRGRSACVTTAITRGRYPRVCMYGVCMRVPPPNHQGALSPCVCVSVSPQPPPGGAILLYVCMYVWCVHVCSPCHHQGALSPCLCVCVFVFPLLPRGGAVSVCQHSRHQGALVYVCMYVWCVHVCSPCHHQGALSPCMCVCLCLFSVPTAATRGRCHRVYVCICVPTAANRERSPCVPTATTRGRYPRVCMYGVCVRVPPATTRGRCHRVSLHHQGALPSKCPSAPPGGAALVCVYICVFVFPLSPPGGAVTACPSTPPREAVIVCPPTTRGRCSCMFVCVCSPPLPPEGAVFACSPTTTTRGRCPRVAPPPPQPPTPPPQGCPPPHIPKATPHPPPHPQGPIGVLMGGP